MSTLNSKLPKASSIKWCEKAGGKTASVITTTEAGRISWYSSFLQDKSKKYAWQVQYRWKTMYTIADAKKKGAAWTNWTAWKNPVSGLSWLPSGSGSNPDSWNKANRGLSKTSDRISSNDGKPWTMSASADGYVFQYRIRSYDPSKKKHGDWTYSGNLYVFRRASVINECARVVASGGFRLSFAYSARDDRKVTVTGIKDSKGNELVKKSYTATPKSGGFAAAAAGKVKGYIDVPIGNLTRAIVPGEVLTISGYMEHMVAESGGKVKTRLFTDSEGSPAKVTVDKNDPNIDKPNLKVTMDRGHGAFKIEATRSDVTDRITGAGVTLTYKYNNVSYSLEPYSLKTNLSAKTTPFLTAVFYPPFNVNCTVAVTMSNDLGSSQQETAVVNVADKRHYLDGRTDAAMYMDVKFDRIVKRSYEASLPQGRAREFLVYGSGATGAITLKGTIIDDDEAMNASYRRWKRLSDDMGVRTLRRPDGEAIKVAITAIRFGQVVSGKRDVEVDLVEV